MLLTHSGLYLIGRGLPGILNVLGIAFYTRLLAPDDFGRYALALSAIGFFNVVFFQWLRVSVVRFLPIYQTDARRFSSTVTTAFVAAMVITGVLGVVLAWLWSDKTWRGLIMLAVPLLWAQAWFEISLAVLQSNLQPIRYGFLSALKSGSAVCLGVGLVLAGFGAYGPLLALLLSALVVGILGSYRQWITSRVHADTSQLRELMQYGLPLTGTFALAFLTGNIDRFMIAAFVSEGAAGVYAASYDLTQQTITLLMMAVNLAAYPLAVRSLVAKGREAAQLQVRQSGTLLLIVAVPAAAGCAVLAPNIAEVILGQEFREPARTLLPIIAAASLLAGVKAFHFDLAFQLGRWTLGQVWVLSIAAIANGLLNLWLIPTFGIFGAAWATFATHVVALVLSALWGRRVFAMSLPWGTALRVGLAAVGMAAVLAGVREQHGLGALVLQISLGAVVYGLLIVMFNIADCRILIHNRLKLVSDVMRRKV